MIRIIKIRHTTMMGSFLEAIANCFDWLFCASVDKHVHPPPSKSFNEEFGRKLNDNLFFLASSWILFVKFTTVKLFCYETKLVCTSVAMSSFYISLLYDKRQWRSNGGAILWVVLFEMKACHNNHGWISETKIIYLE